MLLLLAAGLKIYGFGVDPVARSGIFSAPAFQFLIIAFELTLGVWLLSAWQQIGSWLAVLVTFSLFAAVSFYQGWVGQASCGCLGSKVSASPWLMFTVDLIAVAALLLFRPDLTPLWVNRRRVAWTASGVAGGYLVLMTGLAVFAHIQFGSIDAALASLRSERLSVSPGLLDMGIGVPGETREATLELTNRTENPILLIGGTADGSCTVIGDLPLTIPPGESRLIKVEMRLPNRVGIFDRKAQLILEDEGFKKVGFRLTGRIKKKTY
ncbi:MAG: hypothetical protein HY289_05250 [Planctomycetes bacterium]|nr:hypothetical protein [Planctomycetota bacterium]